MKLLLYILFYLLSSNSLNSYNASIYNFLDEGSYIRIHVKTNIDEFPCDYVNQKITHLPNCNIFQENDRLQTLEAMIEVPIKLFDCGNTLINKDFCDLLNQDDYPFIVISIDSLKESKKSVKHKQVGNALIKIHIAGKIKNYQVEYYYDKANHDIVTIKGNQMIDITDFGLEPPSKVMGLIKTNKYVLIEFEFNLSTS